VDALGLYLGLPCGGDVFFGCGWPFPIFLPIWPPGDEGSGGGGRGHPPSTPPPSNPPSTPPSQPVHFPNETLGIPNGMNINFGGIWGAIIPNGNCADLGPCMPIGSSFLGPTIGMSGGFDVGLLDAMLLFKFPIYHIPCKVGASIDLGEQCVYLLNCRSTSGNVTAVGETTVEKTVISGVCHFPITTCPPSAALQVTARVQRIWPFPWGIGGTDTAIDCSAIPRKP